MSFESSSDETSQTLSVEIPRFSSADSSLASSPTGILSPSSSHASSTTSLAATLNVKFAPLPELAPRRRKSAAPLGMAARSQMVARRRQQRMVYVDAYQGNAMWTEEELEEQRQLAMNEGRRRHARHHLLKEEDEGADDPFLAFGKIVKDAGKSIWRKVSNKELANPSKEVVVKEEVRPSLEGEGVEKVTVAEDSSITSVEQQRYVLEPITPNAEDKKSLDDDNEAFRTLGQTETIREGANYVWITEEDSLDDTSRTPTQSGYTSQ